VTRNAGTSPSPLGSDRREAASWLALGLTASRRGGGGRRRSCRMLALLLSFCFCVQNGINGGSSGVHVPQFYRHGYFAKNSPVIPSFASFECKTSLIQAQSPFCPLASEAIIQFVEVEDIRLGLVLPCFLFSVHISQ